MKQLLAGLAALAALGAPAGAQTGADDPIATHYRAYVAAMGAGDFAEAERAATAAFEASEARDGDGGSTGVLAANLAEVRLERRQLAAAYAPALRAMVLAEAEGGAMGLDPVLAALLLGRAELGRPGDTGARRLAAALGEAAARGDLAIQGYDGAAALARWSQDEDHQRGAIEAWTQAIGFSAGGDDVQTMRRARALLGRGATYASLDRTARLTLRQANVVFDADAAAAADYNEAGRLITPLARRQREDGRMTEAQLTFAQAVAWSSFLETRLEAQRRVGPEIDGARSLVLPLGAAGGPLCALRPANRTAIPYPEHLEENARVGAVVYRIAFDRNGAVREAATIAHAGDAAFVGPVQEWLTRVRFERSPQSPPSCESAQVVINVVRFALD